MNDEEFYQSPMTVLDFVTLIICWIISSTVIALAGYGLYKMLAPC